MSYHGLYTYAWDLTEVDIGDLAVDLADIGIDTITLATSYHAGKFLRPHGVRGKVYFPEDGVLYFRPGIERYGRIEPATWSGLADFDPLDVLARQAPDLARVGWTVCCHNTRIGLAYPDVVAHNCFDDGYVYSLCPAHQDVRDYVVAMCRDLALSYELSALVLETPGWLPYDHGYHHEAQLHPLDRWARLLLGLCFSEASLAGCAAAGIDGEGLKARTRGLLERWLAAEQPIEEARAADWIAADLALDTEWGAYHRWRAECVASLVAEVRDAVPDATELRVIPSVQRPSARCWIEGSDLAELAAVADGLEICAYEPNAAAVRADIHDVRRRVGDAAQLNAVLRPGYPDLEGGADTAAAAAALKAAGVTGLAFYNYGHLGIAALERMRAGIESFSI